MPSIDGEETIRTVREWPEGSEIVDVDELVKPLRATLNAAYELEVKDTGEEGLPYDGYDAGRTSRGQLLGPEQAFSAENLAHFGHELDPASVILEMAIRLGIEQGRRLERAEVEERVALFDGLMQPALQSALGILDQYRPTKSETSQG